MNPIHTTTPENTGVTESLAQDSLETYDNLYSKKGYGTLDYPVNARYLDLHKSYLNWIRWHWHEEMEILIVDQGVAVVSTDDDTYLTIDRERMFIESAFPSCVSISIDYAVMEKADNVFVQTVSFGWSDVGTWSALYDLSPKNSESNVTQNCNVLSYNSSGNIFAVRGEKLVVVDSLQDYIIAEADDVILICPKAREQKIKQMVTDARLKFGDKYE